MTQSTLSPVARHIRRLVAADAGRELSDGELLERFATCGTGVSPVERERAFAALFRRHGPLVWSVCYSVLHHRQDTEDAFQATFLLLARRAGSIRKTEAVASWLYRVAHRVATKAGQTMARRRFQEEPLPQPRNQRFPDSGRGEGRGHRPVSPPEAEAAWRELQALLNEEVQRLPEKYRAPFILCCLEGKTGPEAARQLGWKVGTVTGRLSEARQLLQRRLSRRGVALSSLLTAATIAQARAATACAALADGTIKAALAFTAQATTAGLVSAKAADLVNAVGKQLVVTKLKVATAVLFGVGLFAAGAGALTHQTLADKESPPAAQKSEPPAKGEAQPQTAGTADGTKDKKGEAITYSGRVLDPDGRPVAGAKLHMTLFWGYPHRPSPSPEYATTGPDGRFKFTVSKAEFGDRATVVAAAAANQGMGWVEVPEGGKRDDLTLRLVADDVPITGQIVDLEGRPVPGATLSLMQINAAPGEDLGPWLEAIKSKKDLSLQLEQRCLSRFTIAVPLRVTTDAAGRFRLTGIGRNRLVRVQLDGPAIASQHLCILTRPGQAIQVTEYQGQPEIGVPRMDTIYYGANFRHAAAPTRPIVGVVRDKDTKKPLPGVTVRSHMVTIGAIPSGFDLVETKTDAQGRYRLTGMPKHDGNAIEAIPDRNLPYVSTVDKVPDNSGLGPVTVDIELGRGVWIEGKITDKVTGKPLRGSIEYLALANNPNLRDYPGFHGAAYDFNAVNEDGSYRIIGLPGPGLVAVSHMRDYLRASEREDEYGIKEGSAELYGYPGNYAALTRINPTKGSDAVKRDVTLEPGWTFTGTVLGPDCKPLAGARSIGLVVPPWNGDGVMKSAQFTVRAFNPRRPRVVFFRHLEKGLVGVVQPPKGNGGSVTVRMEPGATVTGRLVDADRKPRADVQLEVEFHPKESPDSWDQYSPDPIKTDKEGRFCIQALLPGYEYLLSDGKGNLPIGGGFRSGMTKDLGDVQLKPAGE